MLRVLHLTDPHLFADRQGALRGAVTFASLRAVLADYDNGDWNADLAVVTGDLIQDDTDEAYAHFRTLLGALGIPVYCLPGNHDVRKLMQATLSQVPFYYCASYERDNWLIACIDSCVTGTAGGSVPAQELDRLDKLIHPASSDHVMVCLQHPPVAMGRKWLDSVGLDNGAEFLERIGRSGKVRLAIFGHVHQDYDADHGGIRVIATPSTCRQFAPLSDEFAVDDNPPAYRRISLDTDGAFTEELVWVDAARNPG